MNEAASKTLSLLGGIEHLTATSSAHRMAYASDGALTFYFKRSHKTYIVWIFINPEECYSLDFYEAKKKGFPASMVASFESVEAKDLKRLWSGFIG